MDDIAKRFNTEFSEKMARMDTPPNELFRKRTDLYSAFDSDGIPTHDISGKELSKCSLKKLKKEWEKQKTLYESHYTYMNSLRVLSGSYE